VAVREVEGDGDARSDAPQLGSPLAVASHNDSRDRGDGRDRDPRDRGRAVCAPRRGRPLRTGRWHQKRLSRAHACAREPELAELRVCADDVTLAERALEEPQRDRVSSSRWITRSRWLPASAFTERSRARGTVGTCAAGS
jgi:hypothetical protein